MWNEKGEGYVYFLDVVISVYDEVNANEHICKVL